MISETKEELNELFTYSNGFIYRKKVTARRHKLNEPIGYLDSKNYWRTTIKGKEHFIHRIIYKMFNEVEPKYIDHISGDPYDNRIENLQAITKSQNRLKGKVNKNSYLKITGVYFIKSTCKYLSQITVEGKTIHLGYFDNIFKAKEARFNAEKKYITCKV